MLPSTSLARSRARNVISFDLTRTVTLKDDIYKGSFTYDVISRGGFQMITVDYGGGGGGGGGGMAVDYVIQNLIFSL